jgi:hypothetical protein
MSQILLTCNRYALLTRMIARGFVRACACPCVHLIHSQDDDVTRTNLCYMMVQRQADDYQGHPVCYVALVPGPRRIYRVSHRSYLG